MDIKIKNPNLTKDELAEIQTIATELQCNLWTAEYIMRLEKKLTVMEGKLSELWDNSQRG